MLALNAMLFLAATGKDTPRVPKNGLGPTLSATEGDEDEVRLVFISLMRMLERATRPSSNMEL